MSSVAWGQDVKSQVASQIESHCMDCHDEDTHKGGLDFNKVALNLGDRKNREKWIRVYDRVKNGEMPPRSQDLGQSERLALLKMLDGLILPTDRTDVAQNGRAPIRRLCRDEYQQNLRDILHLPHLDILAMLPEDREGHRFNKTADMLDMSRVQLDAYLDSADFALRLALGSKDPALERKSKRIVGTDLFPFTETFGQRQAMFFARENRAIEWGPLLKENKNAVADAATDETIEMALFRSASWPYYGVPKGFKAPQDGNYKVRISARAVLQQPGYTFVPAKAPVPMTFRVRKPTGVDIINEVHADGGILDIQPTQQNYETILHFKQGEFLEYSLLGLPMPIAMNPNNAGQVFRYPPFPEGGQPGIAFQWMEVEGPLSEESWPAPSQRVLFDDLGLVPNPEEPKKEAWRLLKRFVQRAAREPVEDEELQRFEALIEIQLSKGESFQEAMLSGYKAFLASSRFVYLREPGGIHDQYAIASRLSHFLTNSRPDAPLVDFARNGRLRDPLILQQEANRLMGSTAFDSFVRLFTDYWLNLRFIRRDDPDIRLYPEYRFDEYLVESMERETRTFFAAMLRENLPVTTLVDSNFVYANDRLAKHYELPALTGATLQKVALPENSPWGGLLTQGAILKVSTDGTRSSPIIRGAWVMERLLGVPPPPPPVSVPAVEPDTRGAKSIRELLALHTKEESCANCHAKFDPVGLALENFDVLGGWRTRYRELGGSDRVKGIDRAGHNFEYALGTAIDAAGTLATGESFHNIHDLKTILLNNPRQLASNLVNQFVIYATGAPIRYSERSELETILDSCKTNGYLCGDLMLAFIKSRIFTGELQPNHYTQTNYESPLHR
ncbi:MAG: DUF1592 domain-containing protein [Verrucomicrobiota bacterium]